MAVKSKSQRGCSGPDGSAQHTALRIQIEPNLAMSYEQERGLDGDLKAFSQQRGLLLQGLFPVYQVRAHQARLSAVDFVAVVDWLIDRAGVAALTLSWAMSTESSASSAPSEVMVHVSVSDLGLIGLTMLHRTQRISPTRYLQVLAEFDDSQAASSSHDHPKGQGAAIVGALH
jgi:hypothetical protein